MLHDINNHLGWDQRSLLIREEDWLLLGLVWLFYSLVQRRWFPEDATKGSPQDLSASPD